MDNEMDNSLTTRLDPLEEVNVIDRQNLVTTYVMLVYNTLYNLGESIAGHLIGMVNRPNLPRSLRKRQHWPSSEMGYIYYQSYGPTEWDSVLFDESMSIRLKLEYTPTSCSVLHVMKSESTAINNDLNDAENEQIEARRRARAAERPGITLIEDESSSDDSDDEPYDELPMKRYFVKTESETKFIRTSKGVHAESRVIFGFKIDSTPEPQPDDLKCEVVIITESFCLIDRGQVILTSTTSVNECFTSGDEDEIRTEHVKTPIICLAQTMDEHTGRLLADGITTNYTSIINIISLALILHFGST